MKDIVRVQIKYLTAIRDQTGRRQEEVEFPAGTTLRDVAAWLNKQYGLSLPNAQVMTILNGRGWEQLPLGLLTEVKEGDVICLFSPISGG